ncbi:MAG: ATP-binding protein [Asticcacaulis sp.]
MRYEYENIRQTKIILMDVIDMETGVRGYVLSGDPDYLEPYNHAVKRLPDEIIALRQSTYYEPKAFAEANDLMDRVNSLQKLLESQINYMYAHGRGQVSKNALQIQRSQMDELRHVVDNNIQRRLSQLQERGEMVKPQETSFIYVMLTGTFIGVALFLIGIIVIIKLETENEVIVDKNQRAEIRFRAVMNGINDGVFEANFVNDSMFMSPEFKSMLGFKEDELENTMHIITDRIHPDDLENCLQVRHDYIIKKTPVYNNVFRLRHKDGSWRWVMSRGIGTWDKFGQIRSMVGTHTDITEQKNREEELRQLNADMEAFTYITSHDMRSPLVNLKGFSHELQLAAKDIDEIITPHAEKLGQKNWERLKYILRHDIPESLGFIGNAVDRMDTLTAAILDLSRIGRVTYRHEKVDAQAIFDKCLGAQSFEITSRGVRVIAAPLPTLITVPVALEQIFSNLLDNAVKYLRPDIEGRIEVNCQESARDYIFSIRDNGRGIATEDSDRVFNIFRRARNTGDVRGLGLGMAFVKATLRKLNGSIWFESKVDEGTIFYVRLPKRSPEEAMNDDLNQAEDAA